MVRSQIARAALLVIAAAGCAEPNPELTVRRRFAWLAPEVRRR